MVLPKQLIYHGSSFGETAIMSVSRSHGGYDKVGSNSSYTIARIRVSPKSTSGNTGPHSVINKVYPYGIPSGRRRSFSVYEGGNLVAGSRRFYVQYSTSCSSSS